MEKFSDSSAWLATRDGKVTIGYGPFTESDSPPPDGVAFYVQDFGLQDPKPWKIPERIETTTIAGLALRFEDAPSLDCEWVALDAVPFSVIFQEVMSAIHSGEFEKTVPVVTEKGKTIHSPTASIVAAMTRQTAPLHSYGWLQGSSGFAGATPELLFSLEGSRLETMALAGTARSEDRAVFQVDEKEIREHEYVAQTLVAKLFDLGSIKRSPRKIIDLGSIVHFLTQIRLDLNSTQAPDELIRRLHPTPALGPLPRTLKTLSMLLEWRQRLECPPEFGAPFGLWDQGIFHAVVAIRGIWWNDIKLLLPAGCGMIEASRLVNEWRELRLKREAVKRFLLPH